MISLVLALFDVYLVHTRHVTAPVHPVDIQERGIHEPCKWTDKDRMRVLILEDEAPVRELLQRWLVGWNYDVAMASSAAAALESMLAEPSEILLCDIVMPGRDGLWLAERVRAKWPRTAIIIATGVVEMDVVKKSQQLGAVDYVTKPFGKELLRQALERAKAALP